MPHRRSTALPACSDNAISAASHEGTLVPVPVIWLAAAGEFRAARMLVSLVKRMGLPGELPV